jgi:hypothetical protein
MLCLPAPSTAGATSGHISFNCGHTGHFPWECPTLKKNAAQGHITHPPRGPQKVVVAKTGHVNYTTMEDIPEGEQVLAGTFSLNGYPVVILFDFGSTHDIISKAYTQKHQLVIELICTPYLIRMLGGNIATMQLVMATPLNLAGRLFKTNLIFWEGQCIDVILGMSWIKGLKVVLDIAARTVHLESPAHAVLSCSFHRQPLQLQHFII